MNQRLIYVGMPTPWGRADSAGIIAEGIAFVSTPSHGGIFLSAEMNEKIPEVFRRQGGWYEEDCDWAIPYFFLYVQILTDPHNQSGENLKRVTDAISDSRQTLINWHPDAWQAYYGVTLKP